MGVYLKHFIYKLAVLFLLLIIDYCRLPILINKYTMKCQGIIYFPFSILKTFKEFPNK